MHLLGVPGVTHLCHLLGGVNHLTQNLDETDHWLGHICILNVDGWGVWFKIYYLIYEWKRRRVDIGQAHFPV